MQRAFFFGVVLASSLVASGCKRASSGPFEGRITMSVTRAGSPPSEMTFESAGKTARLTMADPTASGSYALVRPDGMAAIVLPAQKSWADLSMQKSGAAMAAADPGGAPTVVKTGKHESVAGAECEIWEIRHTAGSRSEACIAEGFVDFDYGALMPGATSFTGAASADVKERKLFPLRSIEIDASGKETSRMVVTRIERATIDKARLEVPKDYTYVSPRAK